MANQLTNKMPGGIPYIIGNEIAERFSYYGMKAILFTFMTKILIDDTGEHFTSTEATVWIHNFGAGVYLFPILGALISDIWWGKYRTIIVLSILYCLGHLALAIKEDQVGLLIGLVMIAVGSGGIKPCVSAHVGDQFGPSNKHLLEKVFGYFYISINVGAAVSQILIPILLDEVGSWLAFGLPGGLMILATVMFWMGRNSFTSVEPVGWEKYKKEVFSPLGLKVIKKLAFVYLFVSVFWALFDQTASSIINQAENPLVNKSLGFFGWNIMPDQVQAANPIMILFLVPVFSFWVYPYLRQRMNLTPLKKVNIGMFIAGLSFAIIVFVQTQIDASSFVSIYWQFMAYFILTVAEVMISITLLEFSYTQAPNSMKSFIMGLYLLSVSLGNFITAQFNHFIQNEDGISRLTQFEYFGFFTLLMFLTALLFIFVQRNYKEQVFIQGEDETDNFNVKE